MTWFRIEAALRDHKVLGAITDALGVPRAEAAGLYVLTLAGFAEHEPRGRPEYVSDSDIEDWSKWRGRRGRYATFFRDRLVETKEGERDPPGQIKGWWRQEALLREQERSRNRPGQGTRKARENPAEAPEGPRENAAVSLRGNVDVDGNGSRLLTNQHARETADEVRYTQCCTVAANRGMRENPLIQGFNELVSGAQDEPELWRRDGIPLEVAEAAIYHRAKAYRPKGRNRQATTLGYFRDAVKDAWAKSQGRALEGGVNTTPSSPETEEFDEFVIAGRQLDAARRSDDG